MNIEKSIKRLKTVNGLTVDQIAVKSDVCRATIYQILRGSVDPQISTLKRIADGCNITLSELIEMGE